MKFPLGNSSTRGTFNGGLPPPGNMLQILSQQQLQGINAARNFNFIIIAAGGRHRGRRREDGLVGKTVKIRLGPFKGYRGRVVDVIDSSVRIELESQMKVVTGMGRGRHFIKLLGIRSSTFIHYDDSLHPVTVNRDQLRDTDETPTSYR